MLACAECVANRVEQLEVVGRVRRGLQIRRKELIVIAFIGVVAGDHLAEHIHPGADVCIEDAIEMIYKAMCLGPDIA